MTVPAPSLPSVLPVVTIPKGSGGAASTGSATGFEALLAGLAPGGAEAGSTRGGFLAPEADGELPEEAATAQDAGLALMLGAPATASIAVLPTVPTTGPEGADGVTFAAPEGTVTVNGENHHIAKTGLIGQINAENQFDIVWTSDAPIEPDPFLEGYEWWDPNAA